MIKIIILAAGKGKRMEDDLPKVLVLIKGKPMIGHLLDSIIESGIDKNAIVVVSPENKELIKNSLKKYNCQYAIQDEQLGTGHAIACAKDIVKEDIESVVVFYGDHPFVTPETIKKLKDVQRGPITMMTIKVEDFNDWRKNFNNYGRMIREKGEIKEIKEFKDANAKEKEIKELNSGLYCFDSRWLWENIKKLESNNAQKEYYLTDLIKIATSQGKEINSIQIDPKEAFGVNSKEELEVAEGLM